MVQEQSDNKKLAKKIALEVFNEKLFPEQIRWVLALMDGKQIRKPLSAGDTTAVKVASILKFIDHAVTEARIEDFETARDIVESVREYSAAIAYLVSERHKYIAQLHKQEKSA